MDFATLKSLTIPEGVVTQITDANGTVLWKAEPSEGTIESSVLDDTTSCDVSVVEEITQAEAEKTDL